MAARTTPSMIQAIFDGPCVNPLPFIAAATALVDWLASKDADSILTDTLLQQIETYLAAHFFEHHAKNQQYQSKSTGRANATFQGQTAMVLLGTKYGQTACLLDVTDRLAQQSKDAELGRRRVAGLTWLGFVDDSPRPDDAIVNEAL